MKADLNYMAHSVSVQTFPFQGHYSTNVLHRCAVTLQLCPNFEHDNRKDKQFAPVRCR